MAESVKYAEAGSPGALASSIGWINFGELFILMPSTSGDDNSQTITNTIPGGYTLTFTITLTETPQEEIIFYGDIPPTIQNVSPFGTTGYIGIDGYVALYMLSYPEQSLGEFFATLTLSNIVVTNSSGNQISNYSIIAADAEITNVNEEWEVVTNGYPWIKIDTLPAVSGTNSQYTLNGDGSTRVSAKSIIDVTIDGQGNGTVPASVFSSYSPTQVQGILGTLNGLQGIAFGIIIDEIQTPQYNCIVWCK